MPSQSQDHPTPAPTRTPQWRAPRTRIPWEGISIAAILSMRYVQPLIRAVGGRAIMLATLGAIPVITGIAVFRRRREKKLVALARERRRATVKKVLPPRTG